MFLRSGPVFRRCGPENAKNFSIFHQIYKVFFLEFCSTIFFYKLWNLFVLIIDKHVKKINFIPSFFLIVVMRDETQFLTFFVDNYIIWTNFPQFDLNGKNNGHNKLQFKKKCFKPWPQKKTLIFKIMKFDISVSFLGSQKKKL